MLDLPTEESPMIVILNKKSYSSLIFSAESFFSRKYYKLSTMELRIYKK